MPKRATRNSSTVFRNVLKQAGDRLLLDAGAAENLQHNGLRGNERANALKDFLSTHLPSVFEVGNGEAIDYQDNRTGELDLFVYDRATATALQMSRESALVPAESLYAVVEVKTTLTQDELDKSAVSAKKVRRLKPFKEAFVAARTDGKPADDGARCPYFIFAYGSNLAEENWAQKEYERIKLAASRAVVDTDMIDRVIVLDRGMIRPKVGSALLKENSDGLFLEFYIQLMNFLTRERRRRPTIDLTAYTSSKKWTKLII